MLKQKIVLVNGSRLLRDLLHIVIGKAEGLEVVKELDVFADLPVAIEDTGAQWVVMSLPYGESAPAWVDSFIGTHPLVRFLVVSNDATTIKMKWSEPHEEALTDVSLGDLINILESTPQREQV